MRKAKLMLSAIAVFAVVGGAYAVKANRASDKVYLCPAPGELTTTSFAGRTLTTAGTLTVAATTIPSATCVVTKTTIGQ